MRIGMILDKTFPPDPRVENEAISLIKNNHQVFLFCLGYRDEPESEIIDGIHIKRYLSNKLEFKLSALAYTIPAYSFLMKKKIQHFLLENRIEAIHIHDIVIAQAVLKANLKNNLPIVLDLHENRPEIMKLYPHLQKYPGKMVISPSKWKQKEEDLIKRVNEVIVVTQEAKDEIANRIDFVSDKIHIVPNSVKKSFYTKVTLEDEIITKYKDKFVILYVGDTGLRRGLITAIKAVSIMKESIRNLKLVIVGKNTSDMILIDLVERLKLEDYVDFTGWQSEKLFPSYISSCEIGISPLYRNIHHDTTYANKLFQYMSFGKPVLVSDATAQKNLVLRTNSGLVHLEQNEEDFADKVLQLFHDKELASVLGKNGKRFIEEEFQWEKVSRNLVSIYDKFE